MPPPCIRLANRHNVLRHPFPYRLLIHLIIFILYPNKDPGNAILKVHLWISSSNWDDGLKFFEAVSSPFQSTSFQNAEQIPGVACIPFHLRIYLGQVYQHRKPSSSRFAEIEASQSLPIPFLVIPYQVQPYPPPLRSNPLSSVHTPAFLQPSAHSTPSPSDCTQWDP